MLPNLVNFSFCLLDFIDFYNAINWRWQNIKKQRSFKSFLLLFSLSTQSIIKQQRHMLNANFLFVLQRLLFLRIWNSSNWKNGANKCPTPKAKFNGHDWVTVSERDPDPFYKLLGAWEMGSDGIQSQVSSHFVVIIKNI